MAEISNAANQTIDTNQPKPLRGLKLRGVKVNKVVHCEGLEGARPCIVREEDYDKNLHGPKSASDQLPTRTGKKKASKKSSDAADTE